MSTQVDCQGRLCAPPVEDIDVEKFYIHEEFNLYNDIALVKLKTDVDFKRECDLNIYIYIINR